MRVAIPGLALAVTLGACGGAVEEMPKPLRHTIDDFHIAAVPLEQKQAVLQAKQDYDVAQMERARVQSELADVDTKISIARNEAEQMVLAEKSAESEKTAAKKSADLTRQNNAERELHTAQLGKRAADAKVEFLKAKRAWLKKAVRYGDFSVYAAEAKLQLEKAKVAKANNIRPAGFQMSNFEKQYKDRMDSTGRARGKAEDLKKQAESKRQAWNKKEQEYMAALGKSGQGEAGAAGLDGPAPGAGTSTSTPEPTVTSTDNNQPLK